MERSITFSCKVILAALQALMLMPMLVTPLWAFNSEEHKFAGDWASSEIRLDTSIELPYPTRFYAKTKAENRQAYRQAKRLAIGTATLSTYNDNLKPAQDHSYWHTYAQLEGNKATWEVPESRLTERLLAILGRAEGVSRSFTFGDLISLYGDYRRTTFCSGGTCYLTHANTATVGFYQGWDCYLFGVEAPDNSLWPADCGYRPARVDSTVYLRRIAAGLWPPYGNWGNTIGNTARTESDYFEAGWWGDEMMRIAVTNDWHFSNAAVAWYIGMHRLALHYVDMARTNPDYWNHALHYEANALHSLSDLFAFGHVVTSRDETSYGIMSDFLRQLTGTTTYQWMEHVIQQGGGVRLSNGRIELPTNLPPIVDTPHARNDFLPSYITGTGWELWGKWEHDYHSDHNKAGAVVRNLIGWQFTIYGDAKLRNMTYPAPHLLKNAIRISLRSLFDAYVKLDQYGDTVEAIGAAGSDYFDALRYIPVFVESDPGNYFNGRWTRYAEAINTITGMDRLSPSWSGCQMPYINGGENLPAPSATACTTFPAVATNNPANPNNPASAAKLIAPADGEVNVDPPTTFEWTPSIDPDGDAVTYDLMVCDDPNFPVSCGISFVIPSNNKSFAAASGIGLFLFAAGFIGTSQRRKKIILPLGIVLLTAISLTSCGGNGNDGLLESSGNDTTVSHTLTDLQPATTYYWKVIVKDRNGYYTESEIQSFITR